MDNKEDAPHYSKTEHEEETRSPAEQASSSEDVHNAAEEKGIDVAKLEESLAEELSPEHREYLLARHGTLDLNPMPSMDPADPLNWPAWKV